MECLVPTETQILPNIDFGRAAPGIPVTDMSRAIHFYSEILGMNKTFENGSPVGFAIMERGNAELHLTLAKKHVASDRNLVHLMVSDAAALHDHLAMLGVRIIKGLKVAEYGLRGFVFTDPDGNRIDVGQQL
jgi:catechol 2,3-dioxygenase-like lactoylglutathione lyase family enzyme